MPVSACFWTMNSGSGWRKGWREGVVYRTVYVSISVSYHTQLAGLRSKKRRFFIYSMYISLLNNICLTFLQHNSVICLRISFFWDINILYIYIYTVYVCMLYIYIYTVQCTVYVCMLYIYIYCTVYVCMLIYTIYLYIYCTVYVCMLIYIIYLYIYIQCMCVCLWN